MREANTRATNYYQLAFVEDMVEEVEELDDVLEVKEKTTWKLDEGRRRNLVDLLLEQENITDI